MPRIDTVTAYEAPSVRKSTMTVFAIGGDVTVAALSDGSYQDFHTVTAGTCEVIEYGRLGLPTRVTPAAAAEVSFD